MTYDDWLEQQYGCYYVEPEFIEQEIDHALADITSKLDVKGVMWRNSNRDPQYSYGGYDDFLHYDVWIDLPKVHQSHPLRERYPFAFLADKLDFAYEHQIDISTQYRYPHAEPRWEWSYQNYINADDDTPFEEGTIYDGMTWDVIAQLMSDQTDALMEILKQYYDDACHLALVCLREDFDYFFSEERYREEMEL